MLLPLLFLRADVALVDFVKDLINLEILAAICWLVACWAEDCFAAESAKLKVTVTHRWIRRYVLNDTCSLGHVPGKFVPVDAGSTHLRGPRAVATLEDEFVLNLVLAGVKHVGAAQRSVVWLRRH